MLEEKRPLTKEAAKVNRNYRVSALRSLRAFRDDVHGGGQKEAWTSS